MKKTLITVTAIIIVVLMIIGLGYLGLFDSFGLKKLNPDENILDISADGDIMTILTDSGNVYVKGVIRPNYNYGLNRFRQDKPILVDFVQIYGKQDAVFINTNESGGCIITNQSKVYAYINGSKDFKTPKLICTGYIKASVVDDNIYLLSDDGSFGCLNVASSDDYYPIGNNVIDFSIEYLKGTGNNICCIIFALTKENQLYVLEEKQKIDNCNLFIDGIEDFDTLVFRADLPSDRSIRNYIEIGLLNTKHESFWYEGHLEDSHERFVNIENYILTGRSIKRVLPFKRGVAMLKQSNEVALYGYDFGHNDTFFGETEFFDVKNIFSGPDNLIVQYMNDQIDYYGYVFNQGTKKYIHS